MGITPGLVVSETDPFLAVSPDLEVSCSCHPGEIFLVEIKSPYTIRHTIPSADNLDYLENVHGEVRLKRNHQYFTQIQGQLGITKTEAAFSFVYTQFGYHLEKIMFDETYWNARLFSSFLVYISSAYDVDLCLKSCS